MVDLNTPRVGDKFYHEGRKHPTKVGYHHANGRIINILYTSDDPNEPGEPFEIIVDFGEDDIEAYFSEAVEWTDTIGGYWYVT